VHALTLAAASDCWDMERMEILGNAFLKYSVGLFSHFKMGEQGWSVGDCMSGVTIEELGSREAEAALAELLVARRTARKVVAGPAAGVQRLR
jgi:hypothetical protein